MHTLLEKMSLISGESAHGGAVTLLIIRHMFDIPTVEIQH